MGARNVQELNQPVLVMDLVEVGPFMKKEHLREDRDEGREARGWMGGYFELEVPLSYSLTRC